MYCRNCGKQIDDNAQFCPECGVKQVIISNTNNGYIDYNAQSYANNGYTDYNAQNYANNGYTDYNAQNYANNGYTGYNAQSYANNGYTDYNAQSYTNNGYTDYNAQSYANNGYTDYNAQSYADNGYIDNNTTNYSFTGQKSNAFFDNTNNYINGINKKTKLLIICISGAVASFLIFLVLLIAFSNSNSYEKKVKQLIQAESDCNYNRVLVLVFPSKVEDALNEELKDGDLAYLGYDSCEDLCEDMYTEFNMYDYKGFEYKDIEIVDEDKMTNKQLKDFKEMFEDNLGISVNVKEAYYLEVDVKIREKGTKQWHEETVEYTAYKVSGKWYILPTDEY